MARRYAQDPLPFIFASVGVVADTVALWQAFIPKTIVNCPIGQILNAFTMKDAILPLAIVRLTVLPGVLAVACRLVLFVAADENTPIRIYPLSLPMSLTISKFALVKVTVRPYKLADTVRDLDAYRSFVTKTTIKDNRW